MFFRKSSVGKKIVPGPRDWRDSFVTCPRSITMRVCIPLTCDVYSQIPPHTVIQPAGKHVLCRENFGCCEEKVIVLVVHSPHPRKDSSYKIRTRTIRNSQPKTLCKLRRRVADRRRTGQGSVKWRRFFSLKLVQRRFQYWFIFQPWDYERVTEEVPVVSHNALRGHLRSCLQSDVLFLFVLYSCSLMRVYR